MCAGKIAEKPFYFGAARVPIYSMEELCYYIYHNVETISDELFDQELVVFMKEEMELKERGSFIESLLQRKASVKDLIVSIFCSTDYYDQEEIKQLLAKIDQLYAFSPAQRRKLRADNCMKREMYKEAMKEYRYLLTTPEGQGLTQEEYGDILHNIAFMEVRVGAFSSAAEKYREAYERNGREESLKQYLYALKLGKQEVMFEREMKRMVGNRALYDEMEKELYHVAETQEISYSYHIIQKLLELKETGKLTEYYELLDEMLSTLKEEYRRVSI